MKNAFLSRWILAVLFIGAGLSHLLTPAPFVSIMPPYLPYPLILVLISGVAEIAGGLGILVPSLRRAAGWGLIALLIAVFPANIHMAMEGATINGQTIPSWILWLRLPLQFALIYWVYRSCLKRG